MSITLIPPTQAHIPQLGYICFHAFKGIADAHNFPYDFPDVTAATMLMGMLVSRPDFHGIVAVDSSSPQTPLGFNFVQLSDPVAGVGPICVDPTHQSRGLGKRLMQHIIDYSLKHHGPHLRLLQEAHNLTSLSLYTALGFAYQEPILLMSVIPAQTPDSAVRPLTAADLDACEDLSLKHTQISRRNELAVMIQHGPNMGCIPHGRFSHGNKNENSLVAYLIPGFFGHAVANTTEDLLTTARQVARNSPPPFHRILLPTRHPTLVSTALARGFRSIKLMSLMTIGPYSPPTAAWAPSIGY